MPFAIATLYTEELKATMRGRFAWLGAAAVLLVIGALATLSTQGGWLQGYGIIAYCLVPLTFVPIAAGTMASPRANRFVECVFTAPVNRRDWLAAKFLVLLTLAAAYYIALLPAMLVYAAHVGVPFLLHKYLLWTPGILLATIAIGSLIGVLFIGRSVVAPMGAAMGVLLAYVVFLPMQELMASQGNGATRTGHITLASPAVLLKNALGFALGGRFVPSHTRMTWISLGVIVFGSLLLAAWVFLRAQGVETWETTRPQRWAIVLAILAIALFPMIFAETTYDSPAPALNRAPLLHLGSRHGENAALVRSGAPLPRRCCGLLLNWDSPLSTLSSGRGNPADLLLLLPVDTARSVTDFHATIAGEDGLEVTTEPASLNQPAPPLESRVYPNDSGPQLPDGSHLAAGWIVRVPTTLDPRKPWDIGQNRYPLDIAATYAVSGDPQPHMFEERAGVEVRVGGAMAQMAFAAGFFPLCCLGAAFARWRRTR
jgi:ABC-type transport system involved in multi-copper enzyme maturation permease subunit